MAQLPVGQFLTERLQEFDSTFELRKGTAFEQLFFKPIEYIVQPLIDDAYNMYVSQSLLRILKTESPDSYDETVVDDILSNIFVFRNEGNKSGGVARIYYNEPIDKEFAATALSFNGGLYTNPSPFFMPKSQMTLNIENGMFYIDIPIESLGQGEDTVLGVGELVEVSGDVDAVLVTNLSPIIGGLDRETNTEFINRAQQSIGVRDLTVEKGFRAVMWQNFSSTLAEIQPIGMGDLEMMRDIFYNIHVGGRTDGYVKTSSITIGSKDFVGMLTDRTRQTATSINTVLNGTVWTSLGNPNVDRSNNKIPKVSEIKPSTTAEYISTVSFSTPINLSANQYVRIGIDGRFLDIRVAGSTPSATVRNEIVNLINAAFGQNVAFAYNNTIRVKSLTNGLSSQVVIANPTAGTNAIELVFGLSQAGSPHVFNGEGPVSYVEGVHYEIDDSKGEIRRIIGPEVLATQASGQTVEEGNHFLDGTTNIFLNVTEKDIISILSGPDAGDYRVLSKVSENDLIIDGTFSESLSGISYLIRRTGIKDGENVYTEYSYNPVSIDIGKLVKLDEDGRVRGIRPGREDRTITDLPLVRIISIEEIDPLTKEPTGYILEGRSGYGRGGYGRGGYGIGNGAEWRLIVNSPAERFSMFEDSYIVLSSAFLGLSVRVNYEFTPEVETYHNFVRSGLERVIDGDVLIKHMLPAYVSGTIKYSVDSTDSSIPDNETLTTLVKERINKTRSNSPLQISDIMQFISRTVDQFDRFGGYIEPFTLSCVVHNTDGTLTMFESNKQLIVPTLDPFPKYTTHPLSPRITHWIADEIILERL